MNETLIRGTLLAAGVLLGVHAVAHAQTPDSTASVVNIDDQHGQNLLRLNSDGGFVVKGTPDVGEIPAKGPGVRMMWFPTEWAFRVGEVRGSFSILWDSTHIGNGSAALGLNPLAAGYASFAAGNDPLVRGAGSVALGSTPIAHGDSSFSAINGWADTTATGAIAIGYDAEAHAEYALALGDHPKTSGRNAIAIGPVWEAGDSSVAIGWFAQADGSRSVAIGFRSRTNLKRGAIVITDHCHVDGSDYVDATADNQITMRGCGGFRLYTDSALTAGVELAPGGSSWLTVSDVNRKENFEVLDGEDVLRRLREVPVMTWNYKSQDPSIRHAGPTAQDFYAAFGLGESELMINTVDIDGINLAAVKALEARTRELRAAVAEIEKLRAEVAAQKQRIEALEQRQREIRERLGRIEGRR